jgi:hypothetical protein
MLAISIGGVCNYDRILLVLLIQFILIIKERISIFSGTYMDMYKDTFFDKSFESTCKTF